jgi:hypothetical protein
MVLEQINRLYVMKQAGFWLECCGKCSLIHAVFDGQNSGDQLTKQPNHCFSIITNELDASHE